MGKVIHIDAKKVTAAALTVGILWGGAMALAALTAPLGWMGTWVVLWSDIYVGYGAGLGGAIVGFLWGFFDAAIIVAAGGLLYAGFLRVMERRTSRVVRGAPRI